MLTPIVAPCCALLCPAYACMQSPLSSRNLAPACRFRASGMPTSSARPEGDEHNP
jgi:hypothetical protein